MHQLYLQMPCVPPKMIEHSVVSLGARSQMRHRPCLERAVRLLPHGSAVLMGLRRRSPTACEWGCRWLRYQFLTHHRLPGESDSGSASAYHSSLPRIAAGHEIDRSWKCLESRASVLERPTVQPMPESRSVDG